MSYFVEPLLEQWNRQKLEITLYSCGERFDDYSARLQAKADNWVNLCFSNDEACISQILQDEIDILVDLAGHTAGNRLALFGAKAAPSKQLISGITARQACLKWTIGSPMPFCTHQKR